jgi:hypothetical protein
MTAADQVVTAATNLWTRRRRPHMNAKSQTDVETCRQGIALSVGRVGNALDLAKHL